MKRFLLGLRQSNFLKHNLIFFIGSMAIAVLNYIYYPVISRLVSVRDFGEIQAIIAIFMQIGILLTAFGYAVTHAVNNEHDKKKSQDIILQLERVTLVVSIVVFIIFCLASVLLKDNLQFTSIVPFILVGFLVVVNVSSTSRTYVLQGMKKLADVSISGIIFASSKLILSVILIIAGFNVVGVMLAYIIAQIFTLGYLTLRTRGHFPGIREGLISSFKRLDMRESKKLRAEVLYGFVIASLLFMVTILYSFDVVVARFFLTPLEAGEYSGISAVARIVYFITVSISGVLIATVRLKDSYKESRLTLLRSGFLVLLIGGTVLAVFTAFPDLAVSILLGKDYLVLAHLLPFLSLVMLMCSINNLLVCFQIARRQYRALYAAGAGLIALIAMLFMWHNNVYDIVWAYFVSNLVCILVLIVQIVRRDK